MNYNHFDTLLVHAGRIKSGSNGPCATPLYQTSSFLFDNSQQAADLFALKEPGHIYTRLSNPTTDVLEQRVAALEASVAAVATSSGQAAQFIAIQNIAESGDNIVSSMSLYGGTYNQFKISFARLGIEFRFAQKGGTEEYEKLIDSRTKAIFIETIGNSDFYIPDFEKFANLSHKYNLPLIFDNTFGAGGYLFRPVEWGANIITHSATKWIGGHGTSIGGIVVDCGNYNWDNGKFPLFTEPSESYHGLSFWESFGEGSPSGNIAFALKARAEGLRDWGCSLSPFNAFLILQGIETLSLRVDRVVSNAQELAEWLSIHPKVERVNYPGLKGNPNYENGKRYLKKGFGGVMSFDVKGSREQASKFVNSLELLSHLVNVGDNKTLITHLASTTHAQLSAEALKAAGIGEASLRISVGIEHISDIKADIEQAFRRAGL
ncbi:MAG: O-acetylhomoserine aminocarboxypropyltransferase/cysteine synthase [Bacteroidales bacterium]|nr:O-acetylhomoserine aminocarboxypropyltransferase/cysteine synthase [Bacteroidales bacterium]